MIKAFLFAFLLLFSSFLGEQELYAKAYLTVRKVEGTVYTRTVTAVDWTRVSKGTGLMIGQLIMVTKNSAITLESPSKKSKGMLSEKTQLTITQPLVARLSDRLLRDIKLDAFFLQPTQTLAVEPEGKPSERLLLRLGDAWERLSTILSRVQPSEPAPPELSELEHIGMTVGHSAKKLTVLSPEVNAFIQNSEWPAELKVVWQVPSAQKLKYHVYVWPVGTRRGKPVAQTRYDFHTVKISKSGVYFIQIASTDGVWQSSPHAVHMSLKIESDQIAVSPDGDEDDQSELLSAFPSDQYVTDLQKNELLQFAWTRKNLTAQSKKAGNSYNFILKNEKNEIVLQQKTLGTTLNLPIETGNYFWQVQSDNNFQVLPPRKLTILTSDSMRKAETRKHLLKEAVSSGEDVTISFGQGI
jgi:hypothetical protein